MLTRNGPLRILMSKRASGDTACTCVVSVYLLQSRIVILRSGRIWTITAAWIDHYCNRREECNLKQYHLCCKNFSLRNIRIYVTYSFGLRSLTCPFSSSIMTIYSLYIYDRRVPLCKSKSFTLIMKFLDIVHAFTIMTGTELDVQNLRSKEESFRQFRNRSLLLRQ